MKTSSKQIKQGAILSYSLLGINIVLGLMYTPWILREIGESDYGLYTLATSLISMFLLDFGMSAAVSRFVSLYRAEGNMDKISYFLGMIYKIYLLITLIICFVLSGIYMCMDIIYQNLTPIEMERFRHVYLIVALTLVICFPFNTLNGILNAFEEFVVVKGLELANKLLVVMLTICSLLMGGGLYALILVNAVVNIGMIFVRGYFVNRCTHVKVRFNHKDKKLLKDIWGFSIWSTIQGIGQQLVYNIIPSILALVANTSVITMFGFARVIEGYISSICGAVDGLFLPKVSQIVVSQKEDRDILPLMIRVGRISQSVIMILMLFFITQGKTFIHLWIGEKYEEVWYCILILGMTYFVSTSQQIGNNVILAKNYIRYQAMITIVSGILNFLLVYFLAGRYGVIGASFSVFLIQTLRVVGNNIIFVKILHLNIWKFFKECQFKLIPGFLISICITFMFNWLIDFLISFNEWIIFFMKSAIMSLIYVIVMWIVGWNYEEKELIKEITKVKYIIK